MQDPLVGRTLGGRYQLLEKIGDGGMALVYRGRDTLLGRLVAVKLLRHQFAADADFLARFRFEARSAASLSHPNVVNIYDVGEDSGHHYIVMEYVEGVNLKELIRRSGPLSAARVIAIAVQICQALEAAHSRGLIHRDIKPHNVLITGSGAVKVTDFGIARAASVATFTETGKVIGSVHYFSPEQAKGEPVDEATDQYALGVVMYEMLTGKLPFTGESPVAVAIKHLQERLRPPRSLNPAIPEPLDAVVQRLMAKEKEGRFPSTGELLKVLRRLATRYEEPDALHVTAEAEVTREVPREAEATLVVAKVSAGRDFPSAPGNGREETEMPKEAPRPKRRRWMVLLIIFFFFVGAAMAAKQLPELIFPAEVDVPNLIGLEPSEARAELAARGLRLVHDGPPVHNSMEAGRIFRQDPEPEHRVRKGREIKVVVSSGPEFAVVPNLIDLPKIAAQLQITRERLTLGETIEEFAPDKTPNTVIGQDPPPGTYLEAGKPVTIIVARGSLPQTTVRMPDVRGMALEEAQRYLSELGFGEGQLHAEPHPTARPSEVIDQNPPPGEEVEVGFPYALAYAVRPAADQAVATGGEEAADDHWENVILISVPDGPTREVVIGVVDYWGPRQVFREPRRGGDRFNYTVRLKGDVARIQVWFDGEIQMNEEVRRPGATP